MGDCVEMSPLYRLEAEHDGNEWVVSFPQLPGIVGRAVDLIDAIDAARFAQEDYLDRYGLLKSRINECLR